MDCIGKLEILTNSTVNKFERNKLFVHMDNFWDVLFQLMKHGTNTLHVGFIFFVQGIFTVTIKKYL